MKHTTTLNQLYESGKISMRLYYSLGHSLITYDRPNGGETPIYEIVSIVQQYGYEYFKKFRNMSMKSINELETLLSGYIKPLKGDIYDLNIDFRTHRIIGEILKKMKVKIPQYGDIQLHHIADIKEEVIKSWPGYGLRSHKLLTKELRRFGIKLK